MKNPSASLIVVLFAYLIIFYKFYFIEWRINWLAKHIQALEYHGELYLQLGEIDEAKKNLEKIKTFCRWKICKEKKILEEAITLATN